MSAEKNEGRTSESIFGDAVASAEEGQETRCLACRIWWKVAVVLVLVAAVAGIVASKDGGDDAASSAPPAGQVATPTAPDQGAPANEGTKEKETTYGPDTVLASVNGEKITLGDLQKALREMPPQHKAAFENSPHELLQQLIRRELLLQQARSAQPADGEGAQQPAPYAGRSSEDRLIRVLLRQEVLDGLSVSEAELREFHTQHKDEMPAGRSFEELKGSLRAYALQEKQSKAIEAYVAKLHEAATVTRNEGWIEVQKARAADNPLDRALATGRPVLADFGRGTCIPCKMMKPILDALKEEYAGRAEILIIDVDEYPAVTQRVGIRAIPTQIFYDSQGKEVYRHQGFMSREAIVAKLTDMGVERPAAVQPDGS
ncbi:MAG: thioredoxin domain-containing protein [Candidatus Brocadiia bacterium]